MTISTMAGENGIYQYAPSKAACVIAAGLFGLSAIYHVFQLLRSRAWFYTSFVVGALSEFQLRLSTTHTLTFTSDDSGLHFPFPFRWRPQSFRTLHRAVFVHHPTSFALRRNHIHDIWPPCRFCQCCRSFYHPSNTCNQGVCLWRRACFLYASQWRRHDGSS